MSLQAFIRRFVGDFKDFAVAYADFLYTNLNLAQIGSFKLQNI